MTAGARLLLVEDDGELSALLERVLVGEGYQVTTAIDGHRAHRRPRTGAGIGKIREVRRVLRNPDDGIVDLEEIHANAVACVRG